MNEANYKVTRIKLSATSSPSTFFVVDFEHVLVCWGILRNNKLEEFLKITLFKPSGNSKVYINQLST